MKMLIISFQVVMQTKAKLGINFKLWSAAGPCLWVRFVLSLHHVLHIYYVRLAHSLSKDSNNRIHQLTRFPAMLRALSGSILVRGGPKFAPKSKGWTVHVNHGWTMCKPKCMVYTEIGSMWLGRAQPVCNRQCRIWLHHVFACPLEGLEPTCQV